MGTESSELAGYLAEAKEHRALGDAHYMRADEIEQAVALLTKKPLVSAGVGFSRVKVSIVGVGHSIALTNGKSGRKGKPVGAISNRWRGNFAEIIRSVPAPHIFGFNHIQSVVKFREDREMRASEIRRLFAGNVKNGYLVQPDKDLYQPTQKLIDLIGLMKHEGPPASTEGPSAGGVAERLIAPDYESGEVQGERPQTNAPQASVGSNPTASAPTNADMFLRVSLAPPSPSTQTND